MGFAHYRDHKYILISNLYRNYTPKKDDMDLPRGYKTLDKEAYWRVWPQQPDVVACYGPDIRLKWSIHVESERNLSRARGDVLRSEYEYVSYFDYEQNCWSDWTHNPPEEIQRRMCDRILAERQRQQKLRQKEKQKEKREKQKQEAKERGLSIKDIQKEHSEKRKNNIQKNKANKEYNQTHRLMKATPALEELQEEINKYMNLVNSKDLEERPLPKNIKNNKSRIEKLTQILRDWNKGLSHKKTKGNATQGKK